MSQPDHRPAVAPPLQDRLNSVARRLRSLHEGKLAVLDAVAIGSDAVPLLCEILYERDRAGVFEPRILAIQALAALGALNLLREFMAKWQPAADPVERLGDEAVVGQAAHALAAAGDGPSFPILLAIARRNLIPGVIEALGSYRRVEALALLVEALGDDAAGQPAQEALRGLEQRAVPALVAAALRAVEGANGCETPSSVRRRRRVLSLLIEAGADREVERQIRPLVHDPDDEIALLACRMGIASQDCEWAHQCAERLLELLCGAAWPLRREIEDCLAANAALAHEHIEKALGRTLEKGSPDLRTLRFVRSLRRLASHLSNAGRPAH
jgi:hypothetical protein